VWPILIEWAKYWGEQHISSGGFTGIRFARTTDDGATWEPARTIFEPGNNNRISDPLIAVLPDGTLACVFGFLKYSNDNGNGHKDVVLSVIRSTDHGQTWSAMVQGPRLPAFQITDPENGFAITNKSSFEPTVSTVAIDPSNGNLYVVAEDNRFSGGQYSSIAFTMSAHGGLSWSTPIQVNQTPTNIPLANRNAFLPSIAVASDGTIGVTYYDLRFNDLNPGLSTDYWMVQYHPSTGHSPTDPASWAGEIRLTDSSFNLETTPSIDGSYFLGDYEGLTTAGTDFLAAWSEPHDTDLDSVFFRRVSGDGTDGATDNDRGGSARVTSHIVSGVDNPGADNPSGGIVNLLGTTVTLTTGSPIGNQTIGGAGANDFGGTRPGNKASGARPGEDRGRYLADLGNVCLKVFTQNDVILFPQVEDGFGGWSDPVEAESEVW